MKKLQRGFTLIELVVVVGIIAILLSITTVNFTGIQRETSLTSSVETLLTDISQQQIKSMVGDTEGRTSPDTYGIHFDSGSYTLFHGTYSPSDTANFIITLPASQQISADFPSGEMIFQRGSGNLSGFDPSNHTVTIEDTNSNEQTTIELNRYGVITGVD